MKEKTMFNIMEYIVAVVLFSTLILIVGEGVKKSEKIRLENKEVYLLEDDINNIEEIIELTNKSRLEAGISPLLINEKLTKAAKKKADDIFEFQYFDHNSPGGLTPWDFIKAEKYYYRYAGENLAICFKDVESAHEALMKSPSHRENILDKNYKDIGIAIEEGIMNEKEVTLIVYLFGKQQKN